MGHSSIAVTLDRYGHLLPSLDADIADGFDREMQAAKATRERKVIHANFGDDAAEVARPPKPARPTSAARRRASS